MVTIEPKSLEPWPFADGLHYLYITAESRPHGLVFLADWWPEGSGPDGLVVARLDYQQAAGWMRIALILAPLFEAMLMETDRARAGRLMNSTVLFASLLESQGNEYAEQVFEQKWLGYEAHQLTESGE